MTESSRRCGTLEPDAPCRSKDSVQTLEDQWKAASMNTFDAPMVYDLGPLDPSGGVLVSTTYWRPRAADPNPERPGEKLSILSYLPIAPKERCPCGSGKRFAVCCQPLPYWRPLCPNPDMQGYSLMRRQLAHFTNLAGDAVYTFLQDDERLYCAEDTPQRAFWIYWGNPAFDARYGRLCFGDFELQEMHTLVITALSNTRMEMLLELVRPLKLGTPQMQLDPFQRLEKPGPKLPRGKHRRKP